MVSFAHWRWSSKHLHLKKKTLFTLCVLLTCRILLNCVSAARVCLFAAMLLPPKSIQEQQQRQSRRSVGTPGTAEEALPKRTRGRKEPGVEEKKEMVGAE